MTPNERNRYSEELMRLYADGKKDTTRARAVEMILRGVLRPEPEPTGHARSVNAFASRILKNQPSA
jgi:hypothetical protein